MFKVISISIFTLLFFTACNHFDTSLLISPNKKQHADSHQPPAHAPAHGRRAQHRYHYYPEADFYYDYQARRYFYIDSGRWMVSLNLPSRYRTYLHSSYVEIEMESSRPYTKNRDHKNKYKKHKSKKNKKDKKNKGKGKKYDKG
ncbi:MAG: hypothetical protein COA44_00910 [Arcobacter sp.]|nr:MAG: hypothetical protein COA44_00910 [Arcobacter sp.]